MTLNTEEWLQIILLWILTYLQKPSLYEAAVFNEEDCVNKIKIQEDNGKWEIGAVTSNTLNITDGSSPAMLPTISSHSKRLQKYFTVWQIYA